MFTKVSFYFPRIYDRGKISFNSGTFQCSEVIARPVGELLSESFKMTKMGKTILATSETPLYIYWRDIENDRPLKWVPSSMRAGPIRLIACPSIDVFVSTGDKAFVSNTLHLKYFFIPKYSKLKADLNKEYDYHLECDDIDKPLFEESNGCEDERRIISI